MILDDDLHRDMSEDLDVFAQLQSCHHLIALFTAIEYLRHVEPEVVVELLFLFVFSLLRAHMLL